jgi:hypothetical protein
MNAYPKLSEAAYKDDHQHNTEVNNMMTDMAADVWRYYKETLSDEKKEILRQAIEKAAIDIIMPSMEELAAISTEPCKEWRDDRSWDDYDPMRGKMIDHSEYVIDGDAMDLIDEVKTKLDATLIAIASRDTKNKHRTGHKLIKREDIENALEKFVGWKNLLEQFAKK